MYKERGAHFGRKNELQSLLSRGLEKGFQLVVDKLDPSIYSACKARTALKDDVKLIKT